MFVGKGWFDRHWRGAAAHGAAAVRPAGGRRQPRRPDGAVQRHLPRFRPGAEMAAARQFPALSAAVPRRRVLPRHRLPEEPHRLRPRLFRRPHRLGPRRPRRARRACICSRPSSIIVGAAAAVGGRRAAVVRRAAAPGRASSPALVAGGAVASPPTCCCPACSASPTSRCRNTRASPTPAISPTASASTAAISPFGDLQVYASSYMHFAPGLSRQCRLQPARAAGQHPMSACIIDGDGPEGIMRELPPADARSISAICRCTTPMSSSQAQRPSSCSSAAASRPWRRCTAGSTSGHRRREQSGGAAGVPRSGAQGRHRRHPRRSAAQGHRL